MTAFIRTFLRVAFRNADVQFNVSLFVKFSCKYWQIMNKWSWRVYHFPFTLKTKYEIAKICIDTKTIDGLILVFIFRARGCFKRTKTILLKTSFLFLRKRNSSGKNEREIFIKDWRYIFNQRQREVAVWAQFKTRRCSYSLTFPPLHMFWSSFFWALALKHALSKICLLHLVH